MSDKTGGITKVSVKLGGSFNLGDFNNARIEISAECDVGDKTPDEAYEKARDFVANHLKSEFKRTKQGWPP